LGDGGDLVRGREDRMGRMRGLKDGRMRGGQDKALGVDRIPRIDGSGWVR